MEILNGQLSLIELIIFAILIGLILTSDRSLDPLARRWLRNNAARREVQAEGREKLALYYRPTCPYCVKVLRTMYQLGIELELRNIVRDKSARAELIQAGGKRQVPCLRIEQADDKPFWLYESEAISAYLRRHFLQEHQS